jgi:PilZ domain
MSTSTAHSASGRSGLHPTSDGERRRASRVWVDLPAEVDIKGRAYRCRVVDVSLTGMVLELDEALVTQGAYRLGTYAIDAGGARPLRLTARTVWRRGAMQASSFVGVPDDERETLGQMVERALRRTRDAVRLELAERKDREPAERGDRGHGSPARGTPNA